MKLALIDIDGLIADDDHRVHFALEKKWTDYFKPELVVQDGLLPEGYDLVMSLVEDGWTIAYLTGRRDSLRGTTENWLDFYGFPMGRLTMKTLSQSGTVTLANYKSDVIQDIVDLKSWEEVVLFDDDDAVIRHIQETFGESHGVHCSWYVKKKAMVKAAVA